MTGTLIKSIQEVPENVVSEKYRKALVKKRIFQVNVHNNGLWNATGREQLLLFMQLLIFLIKKVIIVIVNC